MTFYILKLKLISLITTVSVILLFSLDQTGWAAIITCPVGALECNGTSADDIINGGYDTIIIHGLGGNDYIFGNPSKPNHIFGDNGNDTLIGGNIDDGLAGGKGDDKYDGLGGNDVIWEESGGIDYQISNDIISGGPGEDRIWAGGGADKINGGPDNDRIYPNPGHRDFSTDSVDCGSGSDLVWSFYSGDRDTATYCETITNADG